MAQFLIWGAAESPPVAILSTREVRQLCESMKIVKKVSGISFESGQSIALVSTSLLLCLLQPDRCQQYSAFPMFETSTGGYLPTSCFVPPVFQATTEVVLEPPSKNSSVGYTAKSL